MVENSNIEWTHHTFNPWIGCTKVSPGCDHCYAERDTARFKTVEWGAGKARKLTSDEYWKKPLQWNKRAEKSGVRERVFCASLADVFDNEVPREWRDKLFELIKQTPNLDWLLLTKRIGNANDMVPWGFNAPSNIWLGISVVNQTEANRDIPKLLNTPARTYFLSMEPLLAPVIIPDISDLRWVIVGGESGHQARQMKAEWAYDLRDQCNAAGIPFLFKQWGEYGEDGERVGKKKAGRLLQGRTWDEYPPSVPHLEKCVHCGQ